MSTELNVKSENCIEVIIDGEEAAFIAKEGENIYLDIAHGEVSISDMEEILIEMKRLKSEVNH